MKCAEFESRFFLMLDGVLSRSEKKEMLAHRASCPACARYAAEYEKADELFRGYIYPELPPGLVQKLKEIELAETIPQVPWWPYATKLLIACATAAAVLGVGMIEAGPWKEAAMMLIPSVGWAAILMQLNVAKFIPGALKLLEARKVNLAPAKN